MSGDDNAGNDDKARNAADEALAKAKEALGKAKEALGDLTDDARLKAEGKADQVKAHLKQAGENARDPATDEKD